MPAVIDGERHAIDSPGRSRVVATGESFPHICRGCFVAFKGDLAFNRLLTNRAVLLPAAGG